MTHVANRAVMFGHLLRTGDRARAVRFIDRLDRDALTDLIETLGGEELTTLAALALGPERLAKCLGLPLPALAGLLRVADDADARRALSQLPPGRAARLLLGLDRDRRRRLGRLMIQTALQADVPSRAASRREPERVGAVFRQRRLFSAN
ncbi:MAG: hypothetical protein EP329_27450 [Deltaproteobacteria bacterium]|nr:MAG: hypothetical protein EP329_27450 [Deltaproteobacteria bacterium]